MSNRESFPPTPIKVVAQINFNNPNGSEDTTASVTVAGLSWINTNSVIIPVFSGTTSQHEEPDDAMVEDLTAYIGNLIPGVGFTIFAYAPRGTWGLYQVTAIVIA